MRCNCGVPPEILCDQHLMAEQSELLIVDGMLKKYDFKMKSGPDSFTLGKGHILFWTDKILYLHKRHLEIKKEIQRRGYKVTNLEFDLESYPKNLLNDWRPTHRDTNIIRDRIVEKILAKEKVFWRYQGNYIDLPALPMYINTIKDSPLFYV